MAQVDTALRLHFVGASEQSVGSGDKTLRRMKERVGQLSEHFVEYLDFFKGSDNFAGPSIYFHNKTLAIRRRYGAAKDTLQSDEFFDFLYATLTAWGMHRMGKGNTKLGDIEELKRSFRSQAEPIQRVENLAIADISGVDAPSVARDLWSIISQLRVSIAKVQIVANSKALRHLLPSLVPPIDRTYTYNFFYNRNGLTMGEGEAFQEMYLQFHRIATTNRDVIQAYIGKDWNTSETKTIDNAIVGYVLKELRLPVNE